MRLLQKLQKLNFLAYSFVGDGEKVTKLKAYFKWYTFLL